MGFGLRLKVLVLLLATAALPAQATRLTGSGASFPFPIYSTWFKSYSRANPGVTIDYQAKGSGAGIRDFINNTVDFAGSDAAMSDAEIANVKQGVQLLPITAGAIVIAYNLPGVMELKLPRDIYPRIFMGQVQRWNDPSLQAANPGIELPDKPITVVRRADSSGTTYAFTRHLSAISEDWAESHGNGKTVLWANSDKILAAPKNDGVTATIKQTPGSVGYVEYSYARFAKLPMAQLQNAAGRFVSPGLESGSAALASVEMPEDMRIWVSDPTDEAAWPIVTYSWLLLYRNYEDPGTAATLRRMVEYCLGDGQAIADRMGYVPLPKNVVIAVRSALENVQ